MENPTTEIVTKASVEILTELFKKTLGGLAQVDAWVKGKKRKYDPLGLAAKRYAEKMEERYNAMRIFGMAQPIPLRNIYTRVNVLEKITSSHRMSIEDLQAFFDFDRRGFGKPQDTKDGIEAVNEIRRMIVLGKPGAGKTTFLKHIALQALDGKLSEPLIPIFVSLKNWSDANYSSEFPTSLMAYIVQEFDICNFPDALQFVERMLSLGKCLILLDGFDEVSSDVEHVISQINNFSEKFNKNQYVLSCRIAAYNYCFEKFTDIELADFSDAQIETFLRNWFGEGSAKAQAAWGAVVRNRSIRELAGTPLLLTILCIAFDETMGFPPNKGELYKEGIDALLKKWDSSRSIKRDDVYRYLSLKRKESMLARIAAINFQAGQYFFRQTTLERYIADYIENLPEHLSESDDETDLVESDSGTILRAIEAQHGLFVERAKGIYSFSHLTFQEYFTARYIIDNATRGTLAHLVEAHLTEDRWREVFILVSELLENADHFFGLIREKIKRIDVPEEIAKCVAMILDNARQKRGKKGLPLSTSYYISVALTYIFKTAQSHVPESSDRSAKLDLCIRLLGSIYKTHFETNVFDGAPFLNSLLDLDETTSQNQIKIHDSIRRIATGDVALPIEYLRANIRLVECLQTDCYLSRKLRSSLLTTLFT